MGTANKAIDNYLLRCSILYTHIHTHIDTHTHTHTHICGLVAKSRLTLVIPGTVARQAPLSRQEYWSGLPSPSPGDLPDPGIELRSPALQADSLLTELREKPCILYIYIYYICNFF